jgi:MHS family proline/betaine transporter-like MFS transporter
LLISATGSHFAPGFYLMVTVFLSVAALWHTQKQLR